VATTPERPDLHVLAPTPCEWCSTGLYQRKMARFQVATTVGGATARLCADCAELIGDGPHALIVPVADSYRQLYDAEAALYLAEQTWTAARTVPEYPHEYLLLTRSTAPLTHLRAVRFIRARGDRRQWAPASGPAAGRKVWCHYWTSGEYLHWTQPSEADPILNRKPAP
jgi:hypothetical protein